MDKSVNVLIFPAGEINALELHDALSSCVNIKVFGASSIERHGAYVFKNYIPNVPLISSKEFVNEFNELINLYKIDVIFPTHDTVSLFLSENREKIKAKIVVADKETTRVCRDKRKTYGTFLACEFNPYIFNNVKDIVTFPVFAKPREGQGGIGCVKINNYSDLNSLDVDNYVITEYLPGVEMTVDCFTDTHGKLKVISPRTRNRVMAGVSVGGTSECLTDEIEKIAETINERLSFLGLWFFQIKMDIEGKYKLLEVSTRCAGAMCLTRARGFNLPLLSVYTVLGYDVNIINNTYKVIMDRALISRYKIDYEYSTVYLDFDDTVILNNEVNLQIIKFIYQCKNQNKKIVLITRHEYVIEETLKRFCISADLFDKIISLKSYEEKFDQMLSDSAIFIDNAYLEREKVFAQFGIPVFDVDTVEVLLDWRK